jgi:hypothetical protein
MASFIFQKNSCQELGNRGYNTNFYNWEQHEIPHKPQINACAIGLHSVRSVCTSIWAVWSQFGNRDSQDKGLIARFPFDLVDPPPIKGVSSSLERERIPTLQTLEL